MGFLQGKLVDDGTFVIMDAFPVNAAYSEVSIELDENATNQLINYTEMSKEVARPEMCCGWYHTHPGLTLFFSGVDVVNQRNKQAYEDPCIALVFEPCQMMDLERCRLGAFRTFPKEYRGAPHDDEAFRKLAMWSSDPGLFQPNPETDLHGMNDTYYRLEVSVFKSKLDNEIIKKLFSEGWGYALAAPSGIDSFTKLSHIKDIASRMEEAEGDLSHGGRMGRGLMGGADLGKSSDEKSKLNALAASCVRTSQLQLQGLMSTVVKDVLFNQVRRP
jgi:COP9 signalosome complex subunit 5